MAQVTNTFSSYAAKGQREDLSDTIAMITPEDTPFVSNAEGPADASAVFFEWQTDTLRAAVSTNAVIEGDDTTFPVRAPTTRVGNYQQIAKAPVIISGTLEIVTKAGRKSELARELSKMGAELKRDVETSLLCGQVATVGNDSTARKTASLSAWLKTNTVKGAGGVDPVYTNVPNNARTDGTPAALSRAMVDSGMLKAYNSGGTPTIAMMGPSQKVVFSTFTGIAQNRYEVKKGEAGVIVGTADIYLSDFGELHVVPNRLLGAIRNRDMYLLDPQYYGIAYLRPYFTEPLAKTGDAEKRHILVEFGLKVHNEAAHAGIYDLS